MNMLCMNAVATIVIYGLRTDLCVTNLISKIMASYFVKFKRLEDNRWEDRSTIIDFVKVEQVNSNSFYLKVKQVSNFYKDAPVKIEDVVKL